MNDELFELVDRDYEQCQREEYPRQVKTKRSSFERILDKFTNFRINHLKKKLEKEKDKALTAHYTKGGSEDAIEKSALKIAKLEAKIKFLSKESVPASYVDNRAIKLKEKMCANLNKNAFNLYSVGIENKDEVFASTETQEKLQEEVMASAASTTASSDELDVDTIDRETIKETVNEEFSNQAVQTEDVAPEVSRDDIKAAINDQFERLSEEQTIDRDAIEQTINDEFAKKEEEIEEYSTPSSDVTKSDVTKSDVTRDDVTDAINDEFSKLGGIPEIEDAVIKSTEPIEMDSLEENEPFRVSHNNTNNIRTDRFDSNGNVINKFEYTPMTDEEIRESQIKLGWDENGNPIQEESNKYEYVPMTDEEIRESQEKLGLDENGNPVLEESNKYEYTPMTDEEIRESQEKLGLDENGNLIEQPKDVNERIVGEAEEVMPQFTTLDTPPTEEVKVVESPEVSEQKSQTSATIEDYTALKERILKLKEQKAITDREKEAARRREEELKEKAQAMDAMIVESDKTVAESIELLKAYSEALEEDCDRNRKSAAEAYLRAQESSSYIEAHQSKIDDNQRLINEIGSLIGERPDPETIKVR